MCLGGATPILADLKDSRRFLMVLWKISCISFWSWLTSRRPRLNLWRCCRPPECVSGRPEASLTEALTETHVFPALVQMLLQQVVGVDVLRLPGGLHGLLVHFQAHRRDRISAKAGGTLGCCVSDLLGPSGEVLDHVQKQ